MQSKSSGRRLGGMKSPEVLSAEERLVKLQKSAAFGGRHVPVPKSTRALPDPGVRASRARFRSVLDLGSKLNNDTISTKNKTNLSLFYVLNKLV